MHSILLRYQSKWVADQAAVKVIEKSRRIGISYAEASDAVLHAAAEAGANVYYISYDKEMTSGFIQDCANWAKAFGSVASEIGEAMMPHPDDPDRDILTYAIKFASGHEIRTFSSNPRNLRSKGRPKERLIIDEAAFVDDLDELLKSALAMTMWGGTIHIISTHNGDDNPFNSLVNDIRAGRADYSLHRVTFDDAIADGFYRRICKVSGLEYSAAAEAIWRADIRKRYRGNEAEELDCIPRAGGGAYLSRALIESCMFDAPVVRFIGTPTFNMAPEPARRLEMADWIRYNLEPLYAQLDRKRRHVFGMDFARSSDMSDIVPMEIGETLIKTAPFIIEMHNVPHKQQEQVMLSLGNALPRMSGAALDETGNGSFLAECAVDEFGSRAEKVKFSETWYRENMPKYKAAFEDRTIMLPRHDDIVDDHRAIKVVNGVPRLPRKKTDGDGQRHGDSAIAGVLAYYASNFDVAPMEYISDTKSGLGFVTGDAVDHQLFIGG
jgi:phage FluMu gp28-like protein